MAYCPSQWLVMAFPHPLCIYPRLPDELLPRNSIKKSSCEWCCQWYIQLLKRPISDRTRGAGETGKIGTWKYQWMVGMFFSLLLLCSDFLYENYYKNIPNVVVAFLSSPLPLHSHGVLYCGNRDVCLRECKRESESAANSFVSFL